MSIAARITACIAVVVLVCSMASAPASAAKNVIIMIGDGMGFQQVRAGSYYLTGAAGNLVFEPYYKAGVTTRSLNSSITDSAAAASAIATGHKVNNNAVSQYGSTTFTTILEAAKGLGKSTGMVTTVPITHATPAAFGAHDLNRDNYIAIGNDYLNSSRPDVLFGAGDPARGGSSYFTAAQVTTAQSLGYQVVYDNAQMNALDPATTNRALGLFQGAQLTWEYDRAPNNPEPHLTDMTTKALDLLSDDTDGFFLMVEGGAIDYAAHGHDIVRMTREVTEFNNSVAAVLDWMQGRNDTLLIVTADHETGGLTATNQAGSYPTATWTSTDHTAANVPIYATGANVSLINGYISGGVMDNTKIYSFMSAAFAAPVPEPSALLALATALVGLAAMRRRRR